MAFEMLRLYPTQDFETPFEYDAENFTQRWWHSSLTAETLEDQKKNDYWSFRSEGIEVARAWIGRGTLGDAYLDLEPPEEITDITFFEVSKCVRRQGYGTLSVQSLISHYKGRFITAFPIDDVADSFWRSTGFIYHPRKDGSDRRGSKNQTHDLLFVLDNR